MKILVVDDSKAMRMIVCRTLKQADLGSYTVIEAGNGAEAIEKLNAEHPDLVLSDWNMPEMKGDELLRKIREAGNKVPFGFITSESCAETRKIAIEAGADFLVTKPFTANSIQAAIAPVLA